MEPNERLEHEHAKFWQLRLNVSARGTQVLKTLRQLRQVLFVTFWNTFAPCKVTLTMLVVEIKIVYSYYST